MHIFYSMYKKRNINFKKIHESNTLIFHTIYIEIFLNICNITMGFWHKIDLTFFIRHFLQMEIYKSSWSTISFRKSISSIAGDASSRVIIFMDNQLIKLATKAIFKKHTYPYFSNKNEGSSSGRSALGPRKCSSPTKGSSVSRKIE